MTRKEVRVFAPASVANWGVGFDALGCAIDGPGDIVTARLSDRPGVHLGVIEGDAGRLPREPERNTATAGAAAVLASLEPAHHAVPGIEIDLKKGLPLSSGLGSSAASGVAGALAAAALLGIEDKRRLLRAVLIAENVADGSWHGDNAFACLLGGIVLVPSSDPDSALEAFSIPVPHDLRLVLVHPELELATAESRRALPKTVSLGDQVQQGAAFAGLVAALHSGDLELAGKFVLSDRIIEPARAPLVPGYAAVTSAMREAGALGICLAGAGPSLMAISRASQNPRSIAEAAVSAWKNAGIESTASIHTIDREGARLIP
ncbi:MAG: homoserine kinase [Acidobacteria bacterium]|nr:homoserine kinase [Acidobacteriota bacterium]